MTTQELRIGNMVNAPNPNMNPFKIEYIEAAGIEKVGGYNGIGSFVYWHSLDIEPIPLTEEWLLKFGFELDEQKGVWKLKFNLRTQEGNYEFAGIPRSISFVSNGLFASPSIQYVHQLQNLYFAITGRELA